jgi:hypothetical protein
LQIPPKGNINDFLSNNKNPDLVKERKVLLESFLMRSISHPVLRKCHQLHSLLKGQYATVAGARRPASILSIGSGAAPKSLKKPGIILYYFFNMQVLISFKLIFLDNHFKDAQEYTVRFTAQLSHISKVQQRISASLNGMMSAMTDLGLHFNGWSLCESELSNQIESTGIFPNFDIAGQAFDDSITEQTKLIESFSTLHYFLQEYIAFSTSIERLLKNRHKFHLVEYIKI